MKTLESKRYNDTIVGMPSFTDRVFGKQEISVCCSGGPVSSTPLITQSFALLSALENVRTHVMEEEAAADWHERSLDDLVEYILRRLHRPIGVLLLNLKTLVDMVKEMHSDEIGDLMGRLQHGFASLRGMLLTHFLQEEDVLFPWILSGNGNSAGDVIDTMRMQHLNIAAKTSFIATLASQLPRLKVPCRGQQALYYMIRVLESEISHHICIEDTVLYPRALAEWRVCHA